MCKWNGNALDLRVKMNKSSTENLKHPQSELTYFYDGCCAIIILLVKVHAMIHFFNDTLSFDDIHPVFNL